MASSSSSGGVRSWRTAFLTLRDETLTSPPPATVLSLLRSLVLSHPSGTLLTAAAELPSHEVTSDLILLAQLASAASDCPDADDVLLQTCHLIHDVSRRVFLDIKSSSWTIMLSFLEKFLKLLTSNANSKSLLGSTVIVNVIPEIIEILRLTVKGNARNCSLHEGIMLFELLLCLISCLHSELVNLYRSNGPNSFDEDSRNKNLKCSSLWDMQTVAFTMLLDSLNGIQSSLPTPLWQSVVEILRNVMDFLASKNLIIESNIMSRFYATLLYCLHSVLSEPKGSLSAHGPGFVATLQMFFIYGLPNRISLPATTNGSTGKAISSWGLKSVDRELRKSANGRYRPPHLRVKDTPNARSTADVHSSDSDYSKYDFGSSDSDHSDSDGSNHWDHYSSSKVRLAAISCIQDLCHADPKLLTTLWTLLLPENDVLQPKRYPATLLSSLIFDPVVKIRTEAASSLAFMLEGHSLTLQQVAEYKESSKHGSFTTLSSSLGQKLMQLHTGLSYLIQHETQRGLLASLFKALLLLISATPYTRMPGELLPTLILTLHTRIRGSIATNHEHTGLLVNAVSCLGAALSRSPSLQVLQILKEDLTRGSVQNEINPSVLHLLFELSRRKKSPSIVYEALQALRATSHNYPSLVTIYWEKVSSIVYEILDMGCPDNSIIVASSKDEDSKAIGTTIEKCIMAAIKVLDECLRASSGFKGADDGLEDKLLDIQQIVNCTRTKKVSSAPSYELDVSEVLNGCTVNSSSGVEQWNLVIVKHLAKSLSHTSSLVRAASVTCFAGMTSAVFSSLTEDKQEFVISSAVIAARNDPIPSVRSAACRAIGVMICFPQIVCQSKILAQIIQAVDFNGHDPVTSVRITASWALANICDSLRSIATEPILDSYGGEINEPDSVALLFQSALRLTKDGDKIKSNAVRALGNLSRFIKLTNYSADEVQASPARSTIQGNPHWVEKMVQALVSCVTTGNVKVQWNVCHALSNLFMNDTLKLHDMPWAPTLYSILLLLLRDSTNFKIRIHAAIALAVPTSRIVYGSSFSDIVQSLEHVRESLSSDHISTLSSFKYKHNLEMQITLTTLHVLGFISPNDDHALKSFLIKKASSLEEWFKTLITTLTENNNQPLEGTCSQNQENELTLCAPNRSLLTKALKSLLDVYRSSSHPTIVQRFENLENTLL